MNEFEVSILRSQKLSLEYPNDLEEKVRTSFIVAQAGSKRYDAIHIFENREPTVDTDSEETWAIFPTLAEDYRKRAGGVEATESGPTPMSEMLQTSYEIDTTI